MLTDYHTHTRRCGHATGTLDDYIGQALSMGIGEIGLTDHLHLYFQPPESRSPQWAMAEEEFPRHFEEMVEARERYRGQVNVRVSVEADYAAGHEEALRLELGRYEFDYILGGVHFIEEWMIDDPGQAGRFEKQTIESVYARYFDLMQAAVKAELFDVLAHFDLPKKFGHRPVQPVDEMVAATLDLVRDHGTAIEVSTAGLRKPAQEIYPSDTILRAMRERDIPVVLSSDAHDPGHVGYGYPVALAALERAGYRDVAVFEQRRLRMVSLG